jgi:class 3 adenylate cyclase/predicted ATPase
MSALEITQLQQAIVALEAQRALLGDAVVNAALAPMREKLATLQAHSPTPQAEQRKVVTILFADVSGFTALSETMDAEDVRDMMNALWQRLDAAIVHEGGWIDKYIGDAVMALWGKDAAREDDPEHAVRAALAMQREARAFAQANALSLRMRIGLNTGPVLLGAVGTTQEFTAMGDAVNVASRLEHAAPIGGILISYDTYRHVRGLFDLQALEPLEVKGKSEPIQVYVVRGLKPRAFHVTTRGVEGVETRMVGRATELTQLQTTLQTITRERQLQIITVVGEAGQGKSRLRYEFLNWLETQPIQPHIFRGRASEGMSGRPYALLRDVFAFECEILESDRAAVARQKLERGILALLGLPHAGHTLPAAEPHTNALRQAHFIGHLLGLDFSESPYLRGMLSEAKLIQERALQYLTQLFTTITQTQPTLLVLEDLHWADEASLQTVEHLAQTCHDTPILILGLSRPTLFEQRDTWGATLPTHTRLNLQLLSKVESQQLVADILRKVPVVPDVLRDVVVNNAEGNPFYIEELIKMLIDEKFIVKGADAWHIAPERLSAVRVPRTLTGVLQARLDALPAREKLLLQKASVMGRIFWDGALLHLKTESEGLNGASTQLESTLSALCARELIFWREPAVFAGTQEYTFKSSILRDVVYETVLKRTRRVFHAQLATWLIAQSGERVGEYAGLIAEHYTQAEQFAHAARWCVKAADHALRGWGLAAAQQWSARARELLPRVRASDMTEREQAQCHVEALYVQARVAEYEGQLTQAEPLIQAALPLAEQQQLEKLAEILLLGGLLYMRANQNDEALRWCERGLQLSRNPAQSAQGYNLRAILYRERGAPLAAEHSALHSIQLAQSISDYALLDKARTTAAFTYQDLGRWAEALQQLDLILAQEAEWPLPPQRKASLQINRGELFRLRGELTQAEACNREVIQLTEGTRFVALRLLALMNLGAISAKAYHLAAAFTHLEQARELSAQTGIKRWDSELYRYLAMVYVARAETQRALELAHTALARAQEGQSVGDHGSALRVLGLAQCAMQQWVEAEAALRQSYTLLAAAKNRHQQALTASALRYFYRTRAATGDAERAAQYHQEALAIFVELNAQLDLTREQQGETNVLNWL